ncbi:hypothetical protein HELRODRAFT_179459 [Helobdella robusta]|uniref:Uncharacterized protein n=1 Tax=Helobdella robusta TaxID=6412 RepID=T1FER0_HELRO|nr:hypothetical protein HELRODRAFT_179459 [Helobdella robusta]ESN95390.1 hypothetical protein HELRODRAFT_179459 [Helobdella robusta]
MCMLFRYVGYCFVACICHVDVRNNLIGLHLKERATWLDTRSAYTNLIRELVIPSSSLSSSSSSSSTDGAPRGQQLGSSSVREVSREKSGLVKSLCLKQLKPNLYLPFICLDNNY